MSDIYKESLEMHEHSRGKLGVLSKVPLKTRHDLSLAYTPGVAAACREIAKDKESVYRYTIKSNSVAVVTDGSAVLGLGNIGSYASIPVMEGKAILFKEFAGIDAFPICIEEQGSNFIDCVKSIAPVFGGINLEDIAAPRCFEIEESLQDIGIPVMHDDQHGTAVIALAAMINACKVTGKNFSDIRVAISGAGAAGSAIARMLCHTGIDSKSVGEVIVCDSKGIIYEGREDLAGNRYKQMLSRETNRAGMSGTLADAIKGADAFIGVSAPGIVTEDMIRSMNDKPIVFAMANPVPEIMPDKAVGAGAAVVGTGRSDFPNQINNVLAFPGIFRGALDARATKITSDMKIAAAHALADHVKEPAADRVLPDVFDRNATNAVADAVKQSALKCGCVRPLI